MLELAPLNRRELLATVLAGSAVRTVSAQPASVPRVGWVTAQRPDSLRPYVAALRSGLADLGYEEGRNIALAFRHGDDDVSRVPDLARELVDSGVRVLIAQGAAVSATAGLKLPVPVLFITSTDPVLAGLADSLAHPRENLTGVTFMAAEMNGKRLELLRDIIPNLRRVALIGSPEHPGQALEQAVSEDHAARLGLTLEYYPTRTSADLEHAFTSLASRPPEALSLFADGFTLQNRAKIIDFGLARGMPAISGWAIFAESGALCSYGPKLAESYRRLASYVDRLLKGARASDLPIERPSAFELVVNTTTAKLLRIEVPPTLLARADEVIE